MFVNRVEALKQFVERTNTVLKSRLIADDYDLTDLSTYDPEPTIVSSLWDAVIDTEAELRFVSTISLTTASVSPVIKNGRIIDIEINSSGYGYGKLRAYGDLDDYGNAVNWYGPYINIIGSGQGAVVQSIIDSLGQIVGAVVLQKGAGYDYTTTATVRPFSVLVHSDSSALDNWSIYSYENSQWTRVKNQGYDVRKYWEYIDWYGNYTDAETGIEQSYSQFTRIDHLVENTYELVTTPINIGEIVKVKNIGSGGWLLLIKVADNVTIDYTLNYNVIGRENGSIQFLSRLYDFNGSTVGYDGPLFDADVYDNSPTTELKIILNAIKDKILVDEFYKDFLELFFASVRYALTEQTFIDWAFKTSFVKSMHNVGTLKQKVTYNNDNLENFEDYIKEVKPYRTKVREYVSNYNLVDPTQTCVTDFDLLPVISEDLKVTPLNVTIGEDGSIITSNSELNLDPWANWKDNVGFKITEIRIIDQGGPYVTEPIVKVEGIQVAGGTPAKINAYISTGKVNRLELVSGGTGWVSAPTISIIGGLDTDGTPAKAIAIIGDSVPRSNYIQVKFDRTSRTYQITNLRETETFTGTGSKTQFTLKWAPEIVVGTSYIEVDNVEILRDDYSLKVITSTTRGYTSYSGLLTFTTAPAAGANIVVNYNKNFAHLNAADRIQFYYDPQTGQAGKDLAQLMTGIDYGGVEITGIGFNINVGWDALPWASDAWDSIDPTYTDYIVTLDDVVHQFRMPYVPETDAEINIYISRYDGGNYQPAFRIDDPDFATINQSNADALMKTFIGDGETDIIYLPDTVTLYSNDRVIFRKNTSDGSYGNYGDEYDTALTGGDFTYATASGLAPDDIILDGDDFVTPDTSYAPEEFVPGHVADAIAIKVYHRPAGGCPKIIFANYVGDGETTIFKIGQPVIDNNSIFVKINDELFDYTTSYAINGRTGNIEFNTPPNLGDRITIMSIGFNAEEVLDVDYYISDGVATEYLTKAPWLPTISSTVLVDGISADYVLFSTDDTYTTLIGQTWRSRVGIRFNVPPPAGALINFIITSQEITNTASIIRTEYITTDGINTTYDLTNPVGVNNPLDQNVLVMIATTQKFLKPTSANYFTVENNNLVYPLKDYKYQNVGINSTDIKVYKDSTLLTLGSEYSIDFNYVPSSYSVVELSLQISGGAGYVVGDALEADGGSVNFGGNSAKFLVTQVTSSGTIRRLELINEGQYSTAPEIPFDLIGGMGTGAQLTCDFELVEDPANITINLAPTMYEEGAKLVVIVTKDQDYTIQSNNVY
jgi:hypothetical protein